MKKIITIIFLAINSLRLMASPQIPDYLIYNNDTIPIYHLILEDYFHSIEKPDNESLFGLSFRGGASPNCWRGYQAIYIIEHDSLFLKNILDCGELYRNQVIDENESRKKIEEIFNDKLKNQKIFVDWYSGNIAIPKGDLLRWDGVFAQTYYKEEIICFKKGLLKKKEIVSNYIDLPNGISRDLPHGKIYHSCKLISDTIFSLIKQLDWKTIDNLSEFGCDGEYIITINEKGKISNVSAVNVFDDTDKYYNDFQRCQRKCSNKIKQKIKNLQFDIVKWNGKPIKEYVRFEIFYSVEGVLENWSKCVD
jgi:hypothetical protein